VIHCRNARRFPFALFLIVLLAVFLSSVDTVQAQLAGSFYNVTAIRKRVLPNAVQVTIQTDGLVRFGGDIAEFVDNTDGNWAAKQTSSFRIRLVNARARIPANIDIGSYPISYARVTQGRVPMVDPYFNGISANIEPRVDIELLFDVPISVQRFALDQNEDITFGSTLDPREVSVELGQDRRSIIITVVPDRGDTGAETRLQRSPRESQKSEWKVEKQANDRLRVRALHAPLNVLLAELSGKTGQTLGSRPEAAELRVSIFLPDATLEDVIRTLQNSYDLTTTIESGGMVLGREDAAQLTERIPLQHLTPVSARLLFPDFLLSSLRADVEGNSLLVTGTQRLIDRLKSDIKLLDAPRQQIRIESRTWEFASIEEAQLALQAARVGKRNYAFNSLSGTVSLGLQPGQAQNLSLAVTALAQKGRAKLMASPYLLTQSGERGTLFLGQRRYVQVLQLSGRNQVVRALPLSIGYSLEVTPVAGKEGEVLLGLKPRISTVDEVETSTGLPTLGIREISSTVRLMPGETAIIAGLDSNLDFGTRRGSLPGKLLRSNDLSKRDTTLMVFVTAHIIS
jgi:hypothetical protein